MSEPLITRIQLSGPLDFAIHSSNLVGTLVANTPFIGENLAGKAAGSLPFAKRFTALVKIVTTDPMSAEAATDLHEMGNSGFCRGDSLRKLTAADSPSRPAPNSTGFRWGPLFMGRKVSTSARLVMYRLAMDINPDAKPAELTKFVNQLGNYTRELQGEVERTVKASGFAPFYGW